MFERKIETTAFVQFFENKPAVCGDSFRNIKYVTISWKNYPFIGNKNYRKAYSEEIKKLEKEFPEYKNYISLW